MVKSSDKFVVPKEKDHRKSNVPAVHVFCDQSQVLNAYQNQQIEIHTPIWLKWHGKSENGEKNQRPLEIRLDTFGNRTQIDSTHQSKNNICKDDVNTSFLAFGEGSGKAKLYNPNKVFHAFANHIRTTVGRVLVNKLLDQGH